MLRLAFHGKVEGDVDVEVDVDVVVAVADEFWRERTKTMAKSRGFATCHSFVKRANEVIYH